MITYVNTVLVSNGAGAIISGKLTKQVIEGAGLPLYGTSLNTPSQDAGKFIIMNCDPGIPQTDIYDVNKNNAGTIQTIKVGYVTKKNMTLRLPNGMVKYQPIIKWSNEIKAADIKSYSFLNSANFTSSEDLVTIDFSNLDPIVEQVFAEGGKRIVVRITYKDMPHRYRKWTESYEYVTKEFDYTNATQAQRDAYKASIVSDIANIINADWKRARVQASVNNNVLTIEALPYDDDDSVDSLSWANKVRFNANMYWTDPQADGWESKNKNFPKGVIIDKTPGVQYAAEAKLVRDRESQAMGYLGILNRGEGTWPIIKPDMETDLSQTYDGLTLEFENMYRAADDIFRKTKQTLEIYAVAGTITNIKDILDAFVAGVQQDEVING